MTYLLNTNVICEATAKRPDPHVLAWTEAHAHECCLSCVSLGEVWKGIHLLPEGKRKQAITRWADGIENDFADRVLDLDKAVLKIWGKLYAKHEAKGYNMGILDSLLAATALTHDLTVATRNTGDFPKDVKTLNPWES
ncbi:MAG: type II toxin-antitoxin system VapC family toxin [Prosthecobacter sp.]|nr:type II toxin-antitoxin system VapC family toxin [Prosthecobacter sp.]